MRLLDLVNAGVATTIVVYLIAVADRVTKTTSHFYRCALVLLAVVFAAYVLWPLFGEWPEFMDTILVVSVGLYLLADRRLRATLRSHR